MANRDDAAPELDPVCEFFTKWTQRHGDRGPIGEIAKWLGQGGIDPAEGGAIIERYGSLNEHWLRCQLVDLFLEFATDRFMARLMLSDEMAQMHWIGRALHVRGRDLTETRPAKVAELVRERIELVLAEGAGDESELYLFEIQAIFDLGYDEYLALMRPALEVTARNLEWGLSFTDSGANYQRVMAARRGLEPMIAMAKRRPPAAVSREFEL
jgi:hypothetical protein